jgi:hypothetical protein
MIDLYELMATSDNYEELLEIWEGCWDSHNVAGFNRLMGFQPSTSG